MNQYVLCDSSIVWIKWPFVMLLRKLKEILVRKLRARLNAWAFERDLERGFYYQNGWNTRDPKVWNEYTIV